MWNFVFLLSSRHWVNKSHNSVIQPVMGHMGLRTVLPDQTNSVSNNGQEDCSGNNIQATNPDISFNFPAIYNNFACKNLLK